MSHTSFRSSTRCSNKRLEGHWTEKNEIFHIWLCRKHQSVTDRHAALLDKWNISKIQSAQFLGRTLTNKNRVHCCVIHSFLNGHSRPLFLHFCLFNAVDSKQMFNINFANDWIWTSDLWYLWQPLSQLSHNHFVLMSEPAQKC